jgi:transglutaminase-like putative cysteine protease
VGPSSRLLLGALLVATSLPAASEGLYLHVVPTTKVRGARLASGALRLAAYVARPEELATRLRGNVTSRADDHVVLELTRYPQLEPISPEGFLAASFVVDFAEPAVEALRADFILREGLSPSVEALRRFTDGVIPNKSMARGWDLASQVAASGTGDCTEHAVLLAALARASGRPARVVLGFLIVLQDEQPHAFGHAWAEIHDGVIWRPVDATPLGDVKRLGYLPLMLLENEGPGYAMTLAAGMQRTWVRRVEIR